LHSYKFEIDTEKQRQHRRNNARPTESGNARSEQLLMVPLQSLTDRQWLPGELLSGSEHSKAWLVLRYKVSSTGHPLTVTTPHHF